VFAVTDAVVVMTFERPGLARQALRDLQRLSDAGDITFIAGTVVGRRDDGRPFALEPPRHGASCPVDTSGVVDLLTGPFGLVFGRAPDALVGSLVDIADVARSHQILRCFGHAISPGLMATVAVVAELGPTAVDELASDLGGDVRRMARADVEAALSASATLEPPSEPRYGISGRLRRARAVVGTRLRPGCAGPVPAGVRDPPSRP